MKFTSHLLASLAFAAPCFSSNSVPYPGEAPGKASLIDVSGRVGLHNNILQWNSHIDTLPAFSFQQGATGAVKSKQPAFSITTATGTYPATSFKKGEITSSVLSADSNAVRNAEQFAGIVLTTSFTNEEAGITINWSAQLRDGANYVTQNFEIIATKDINITHIDLLHFEGSGFSVKGKAAGSPLVHEENRMFFGIENPVGVATVQADGATIGFDCKLPMSKGKQYSFSTVQGVYPEGQQRRGFLSYLENERAQPYTLFLQYNGWYDHGLNPTEQNMLATVKDYGDELTKKRGIVLDSFVLDDGWDNYNGIPWHPDEKKFPNGFKNLSAAIKDIGSNFGIWVSPLGGYYGDKERANYARKHGQIPQDQKTLDLAYEGYYNWFLNLSKNLMTNDGVNYFKWDRAGEGVSPHFMGLLNIANELRTVNPKVFLNTTVGTWPSPFWLNHIDSIWRTGTADVFWIGKGSNREQYINFRDAACYNSFVRHNPLYPLSSVMHHGIVLGLHFQGPRCSDKRTYANNKPVDSTKDAKGVWSENMKKQETVSTGKQLVSDVTRDKYDFPVDNDLKNDIRILMGAGANLQELYLTPGMMNDKAWDDVAEAVRWANAYEDVTADVHWVGGNPEQGKVYGYAAWRGDKGATLALRNPDDKPQSIELSTAIFEPTRKEAILLLSPYGDQRVKQLNLPESGSIQLELQPFEVLVFSVRFDK